MRTITIPAPKCAFCIEPLIGEAVELDSGSWLHKDCVDAAAEVGIRHKAFFVAEPSRNGHAQNGNEHAQNGNEHAQSAQSEEADTAPETIPESAAPEPSSPAEIAPEAPAPIVEEPDLAAEPVPAPAGEPYVSVVDEGIAFLRNYLANGERPSKEVNDAAAQAGVSAWGLQQAKSELGVERRRLPDKTWAIRMPGEKRLIGTTETEGAPAEESIPHSEPSIPDKPDSSHLAENSSQSEPDSSHLPNSEPVKLVEPLTPESYVRRRDALQMTDEKIAHWVDGVGAYALGKYAGGNEAIITEESKRHVGNFLSRMEGETDEAKLNAYRYPLVRTGTENTGAKMFGPAYQRLG